MRLSFCRRAAPRQGRAAQRVVVVGLGLVVVAAATAIGWTSARRVEVRRSRLEQWQVLLDRVADDRGSAIEAWLGGSFRLAELIASVDGAGTAPAAERVRLILDDAVDVLGCRRALIVDRQGRIMASDRRSPGDDVPRSEAVAQALEERLPAADLVTSAGGSPWLVVAVPSGSAVTPRAIVLELDPAGWLYPLLGGAVGTTGETVLVRIEGEEVRFLSPLRFDPRQPLRMTLPADQPELAAAAAAAGLLVSGEFRDYRGVPVLAASRPISGTPWKLLVKVDRDEVVADLEGRFVAIGLALVSVVATAAALGGLAWRSGLQRVRHRVLADRARLGSVLAEAGDGILFADGDGRILQANHSAAELYGYPENGLVGLALPDLGLLPPVVAGSLDDETHHRRAYEGLHLRRDGSRIPVEVSWRRFEVDGTPHQVIIARDVSERHEAQARVELLNRLLRTTSEVNQLLVRERDVKTLLREACRIAVEHGGFAAAWVGRLTPAGVLDPIAWWGVEGDFFDEAALRLDDAASRRSPAVRAGADGEPVVVEDLRDEPGNVAWRDRALRRGIVALAALPLNILGGRWGVLWVGSRQVGFYTPEVLSLLREMTTDIAFALELAETESRRRAAEREVEHTRRLEALGRLAGGVAHDFNNQLQAILGNLELARAAVGADAAAASHLEEAAVVAGRAARLTRQLLAFGRRQHPAAHSVVVDDVVGGLRQMLTRLLGERIEFEVHLGSGGATALIDPGQLEQVVVNLVLNARDAMDDQGRLVVRTRKVEDAVRPGGWTELEVEDTGSGLSVESRERLFEPFFTTKDPARGTGLGLATVHGIVHQAGGEIHVNSQEGRGTTFVVRLPVASGLGAGPDATREPSPKAPTLTSATTVLLAEDDAAVRSTLVDLLVEEGLRVLAASSGDEAIDLAKTHHGEIDLLISDVVMPGLQIGEIVAGVRREVPGVRIILMSGYLGGPLEHWDSGLAALRSLQKPFTRAELLRAIGDVLR